jgi:hypothetical protein
VLELDIKGGGDGLQKALEYEAEVLKDLSGHVCIPELYDIDDPIKTLDARIRSESSTLPCLLRTGLVGQPTSHKGRRERYHL